jgi:hypothetical protein
MSKTKHAMMTRGIEPPPPPPDPPLGLTDRYLAHVDRLEAGLAEWGPGSAAVAALVVAAVMLAIGGARRFFEWWLL